MILVLLASTLVLGVGLATAVTAGEGFGAATPGGEGRPVHRVTSLGDSGPGTLRDALSQGHRHVRFDVAGTIDLASPLPVRGPFVTIDGLTASPPGITLRGHGLTIHRAAGAHDVIVRGIRVREATSTDSADCIQVAHGAFNVVLDRVSASGCGDGSIDITHGAHDVTVSWSIIGNPEKTMLIGYGAHRVSLHHNLIIGGRTRNPYVTCSSGGPTARGACADFAARGTTVDFRNNVVWGWTDHGTRIRDGARANAVANLYSSPGIKAAPRARALIICRGDGAETPATLARCRDGAPKARARGYAAGNVSLDGIDLGEAGTAATPFPAPPVTTTTACAAARAVAARAGARPLDAVDRAYLAAVVLTGCPDEPITPSP